MPASILQQQTENGPVIGRTYLSHHNSSSDAPVKPCLVSSQQRSRDMHEEPMMLHEAQHGGTSHQQQQQQHHHRQQQQQHHQHHHRQQQESEQHKQTLAERLRIPPETPLPLFKQLYNDCVSSFVDVRTEMLRPDHMAALFETVRHLRIEHLGFHRPPVLRDGIAYMSIAETDHYSVGVFLLAPGATIPLHDHPNMCVVSNVLFGSVHCRSFDWMDPDVDHTDGGDCYEVHNASLSANDTRALYPHSGGNIHMFTAGGDYGCAILDVLGPPYDDHEGRPCDYYEVDLDSAGSEKRMDGIGGSSERGFRLRRTEAHADFHVRNLPYRGPRFGG